VPKVRFAGTIRPSGHRPGRAITGHSTRPVSRRSRRRPNRA